MNQAVVFSTSLSRPRPRPTGIRGWLDVVGASLRGVHAAPTESGAMVTPINASPCGEVVAATRLQLSGDLALVSVETTTHLMEVWLGCDASVPKTGSKVLLTSRGQVICIDPAGGRSVAPVATRVPLRPTNPALAGRWLASRLLFFSARALEDMHIVPLARQLDRSAQSIGCEVLPGVRLKDSSPGR